MAHADVLDEIINSLDLAYIPADDMIVIHLRDHDGTERTLTGDQLAKFIAAPWSVSSARVKLNVERIRRNIMSDVADVYLEVHRMLENR